MAMGYDKARLLMTILSMEPLDVLNGTKKDGSTFLLIKTRDGGYRLVGNDNALTAENAIETITGCPQ